MEDANAAAVYAEYAVIGGLLMDPGAAAAAVEQLSEGDFSDDSCRAVFATATTLAAEGKAVDTVTVLHRLDPVMHGFVVRAANATPTLSGYQHYLDVVREESRRRRILEAITRAQVDLVGGGDVREAETALIEVLTREGKADGNAKTAWEAMRRTIDQLEKIRRNGTPTGVTTGFSDVDYKVGRFQKKGFYVIGARSGMGKTALLLCMVRAAAKSGKRALVFSLEMPADGTGGLATRLLSQETQVEHDAIRFARYDDRALALMRQQAGAPYMQDVVIDDRAGLTVLQMQAAIRRVKPDVVYIDYIGLIKGRKAEKRNIEMDNISHDLKAAAKQHDLPVIALAQLNRETESRKDGRPTISDIRESDAICHDADAVLLLYRPAQYSRQADDDRAELIVAKNRQGRAGVIPLSWTGKTMTFRGVFSDGSYPSRPPAPPKLMRKEGDFEEL